VGAPRDQSSESFSIKQLHAMIADQVLRAADPSKLLRQKEFPTCTTCSKAKAKAGAEDCSLNASFRLEF
jgi:hypothetical protein